MSYVKITGTNIGNCMTGFGIHYPITVYNSGNAEILYRVNNSNSTNFDINKNSFKINANSYDVFDVFYKPTISSGTDELTDLTISSVSVEDGSVDPSGDITLNLTGTRLTNIIPGNVRSFRAVSNFEGPSYEFYWKAPTGISGASYHNYFVTGYTLQLSKFSNFSPVAYTKEINVAQNTDQNPRYGTYYGFNDNDYYYKLDTDAYADLKIETDYYAKIYSANNGNTGVHIHATGVNFQNQQVSNEVAIGYSGLAINIRMDKKPFDFYVLPDNTWFNYTYDLYSKLVEANQGSNDFSPYSGINIYLPENTVFESQDLDKGAIDLNGKFINLTGSAGTFINFFIPSTTEIVGRNGNGSNLYFEYNRSSFDGAGNYISNAQPYKIYPACINNSEYSDTSNGGPAITLKAVSVVNNVQYTDIKYNFYSKLSNPQISNKNTNSSPMIAGGPGGGKGGFYYFPFSNEGSQFVGFDTLDSQLAYQAVIPCNGTLPKNYLLNTEINRKWWYWDLNFIKGGFGGAIFKQDTVSRIGNPYIGKGEMGVANVTFTNSTGLTYYIPEANYIKDNTIQINLQYNDLFNWDSFVYRGYFFPVNTNLNNRLSGKIIDTFSDSTIKFSLYNNILPSDFVFRFTQAGLSSNLSWTGGSYSLTAISSEAGSYDSNYKSLGYKCLKLNNNKLIKTDFSSSVNIKSVDLDIFFICSFDEFTEPTENQTFYTDIFDWYLTASPNNITKNQFSINKVMPLKYTGYPKENLTFVYKNACLQNKQDETKAGTLTATQLGQSFSSWKISKQLNSLLQISGISSNIITTTTNHNLSDGDIIGFTGTSLPPEIIQYDTVTPYTKQIYYVRDATSNTFKIAKGSVSGSPVTLSSGTGTIHKLKSDSLYRPFILQVRRIDNQYYYFINRKQVNNYIANKLENNLLSSLQSSTFKLINRGTIGINYFDVCFYNRLLSSTELDSTYAYFTNQYFNLFAGEASITSLDLKSNLYSYRLPNIFSIAGRV